MKPMTEKFASGGRAGVGVARGDGRPLLWNIARNRNPVNIIGR